MSWWHRKGKGEGRDEAWSTTVFRDVSEADRARRATEGGFGDKWKINVGGIVRRLKRKKKDADKTGE